MKTTITTFRLPTDLLEKLRKEAADDGRSTNNLLIKILKEKYEHS